MRTLSGRHVLLTGAAGGLGPAIAEALARVGARVTLSARPGDDPAEAVRRIAAAGGAAGTVLEEDLLADGAPERLAEAAAVAAGPVDVLVNNAGVELLGAMHDVTPGQLVAITRLNLEVPMRLARAVLPGMLARRAGHVVNIASLAGKAATPFAASYGATKHGMVGFTRALRAELHGTGVGASAICPGFVADRGMYERLATPTGVRSPALTRTTTSGAVGAAVVRAIREDRPELIVNPGPMRLIAALAELFPSFGGWLVRAGGVTDVQRRWAASLRVAGHA